MIHHVSVGSNDIDRARVFYNAVFEVLGWRLMDDRGNSLDYGTAILQFSVETPTDGRAATPGNGTHIAFATESRTMVDRFYEAALAHGGADAGAPGLRPKYNMNYYGAFVRDPDGNKIEAVTFSAD